MINLRTVLFLTLAFAWTYQTSAQPAGGTVKGVLNDDSGAVIPSAPVSLTGKGVAKSVVTQTDGTYSFPGLAPGQYNLSVAFPGFAVFSKAVTVNTGAVVEVPVQLAISSQKQEVTVQAESGPSVSVEPDNNASALVMKDTDLEALPDDPDDLADALQALAGPGAGPNGGQLYIDGFSGGQLPPKASIREIRINQNPFSAEFDRLGFGRIEILTKPGMDQLRGAVSLTDGDAVFNSRNPFSNIKPEFSQRMWNANVGGPLNKRTSFFLDFQRRDIQNNAVVVAQYFDPTTLAQSPINTSVVTPSHFTNIDPRVDYQLSTNHTLTVRFDERFNDYENYGVGATKLPAPYSELAYNSHNDAQNVMVTESAVLSSKVVNETRFQFYRYYTASPGNLIPQINVAGAFVTGGNGLGDTHDRTRHFELQNNTSVSHGAHTIRFGVRVRREGDQSSQPSGFNGAFTFLGGVEPQLNGANQVVTDAGGNPLTVDLTSLQQYERNVQLLQAGLSEAQIQALGGGPSRFTIQAGQSYISALRWDAGPFIQDDWRIRPNLTLSTGLRYEVQTLLGEHHDIAPRLGFAWSPGSSANGRQKTVIRGGFGIFYDRVGTALFEQAALNNGINQLQYVVYNPAFYPNLPPLSALGTGQNSIYRVDPNFRTDYSMQGAIGVERQLPRNTTVAATYTFNRTVHMAQTVPVNTPLPGTFNPDLPLSATNGVFPYGYAAGTIFEDESGGKFWQQLIMASFNTRLSGRVQLFGNYTLGYANDLPSTPTNPYDFAMDWGRSNFDRRHNFTLIGNIIAPAGIHLAPFVIVRSGQPYDVLAGEDLFGDTLTNARAAFASTATCASLVRSGDTVCSPYGTFTATGSNLVPRDYLTMPAVVSLNMRIYRVFGFGGKNKTAAQNGSGQSGPGGPGGMMALGGIGPHAGGMPHGMGGFMGGGSTEHPYNITLSLNVENLLNHFNPAGYQGVITSPYFLQATAVNTGFGGGGFGGGLGGFGGGNAANNRRVLLSLRFTF